MTYRGEAVAKNFSGRGNIRQWLWVILWWSCHSGDI